MRRPHRPSVQEVGATETLLLGERREITALSYDLIGSTRLLVGSDLELFGQTIARFQDLAAGAIRSMGGFLRQSLGDDGGMAFFGFPEPTEDYATAALRAAVNIVAACRQLQVGADKLQIRVGIATAEVVIDRSRASAGPAIVGLAPTMAARLQGLAPANRIWACDRTRQLAGRSFSFRGLGRVELKGLGSGQALWEVRRQTATPRFLAMGRLRTGLVGRDADLERLLGLWREVGQGRGRVLVVEGEAGIGKSRLVFEFLRATRDTRDRTVVFQCSPHGGDRALGPIADALRIETARRHPGRETPAAADVARALQRTGVHDPKIADAVAFAVGAAPRDRRSTDTGTPADAQDRLMEAAKHCARVWSSGGGLVVVVEDAHWIDPSSRRVIESLAEDLDTIPLLLLLTSRTALRWPARSGEAHLRLRRLRADDAARLASDIRSGLGSPQLPADTVQRLFARAKGVPLFIEEMLQATDAGAIEGAGSSAGRSFSFEQLLASRLATLGAAKPVAQAAAVLGGEFGAAILARLFPATPRGELVRLLDVLVRANILRKRPALDEPRWMFRHGLFQEVLERSLLRTDRVALHRRIVAAGRAAGEAASGLGPAALARHAAGAELPTEAAYAFIEAAKESFARSASTEARNLLRQAQAMREQVGGAEARDRLFLAIAAALGPLLISLEGNRSVEARDLYDRAIPLAQSRPADEQAELFPIYWGWWYTGADFAVQLTRAETLKAAMSGATGAEARLQANHCLWAIEFNIGRHSHCLSAVKQGLSCYEAAGGHGSLTLYGGHDPRVCGLGQAGLSLWFQGYPARAAASVEAALAHARAIRHTGSLAHALDIAAMLHRYREDLGPLKAVVAQMRKLARTHQLPSLAAKALIFDGWRLARLGQPARGQARGDAGYGIQREIGTREDFPVYAGMRAEILAARKEPQAALDIVDEALDEVERTKHLYWAAELYRNRAVLLAGLGRDGGEVEGALLKAIAVAQQQGATALLLRAFETALRIGVSPALSATFGPTLAALPDAGGMEAEIAALRTALDRQIAAPLTDRPGGTPS